MSDNDLPLPTSTFASLDGGITARLRYSLSLQAGVTNLLDRNNFYWEGFPEEGRAWYTTLRLTF